MTTINHNHHNKHLANELASQILNDIQMGNNITPAHILQASMNMLMLAERQLHLEQNPQDKGNGSFERKLGTPLGELALSVPRDRDGDFRPAILPKKHQRDYQEREALLESLLLNGYSPSQIQRTLSSLGLHYNPDELDTLKKHYLQLFNTWQNRELPQDIIGLFIDAYHTDTLIEQKVRKTVVYVAIGIDFNGFKSLYGIYLYTGSESRGFWIQTLNQLIQRGLKSPLIVLSDDFPGLKESIDSLFPKALHQLCFIHMQRNVYRNMAKVDAKKFNQALKSFKLMNDADSAQSQFQQLCSEYEKQYPSFMQALISKKERYFAFLNFPQEVTKYFYTTNLVESFNSISEKNRQRNGGFFQSEDCLRTNIFLCLRKFHLSKWRKGIPHIIGQLYSLRQLFALRYERLPLEAKSQLKFDFRTAKLS